MSSVRLGRWSVRTTAVAVVTCVAALASLALAAAPAGAASIVFIRGGNVWLTSPDGSMQRQVTTGGGWQFASQSDAGTILAQSGTQLIRMDRHGNQLGLAIPTSFTGAPSTWAGPVSPVISPDGVNQAYGGEFSDSGYFDPSCNCWVYTHTFTTFWGAATQYSQPNQTLGQEDYVDPAWIDNSHVLLSSTGILIDQVATYTLGGADNSMVQWFSDPDQTVQGLGSGAITRSGDKLAFVANVNGGVGNEIRIYSSTGPPPEAPGDPSNVPVDQCNIGPNNFQSIRVSFSPDGQSLAYDAPDGIHLVSLAGWPNCSALTDQLIIPSGALPYFGPADVAPGDGCGACGAGGGTVGGGGTGGGTGGGGGQSGGGSAAVSLTRRAVARGGRIALTLNAGAAGTFAARASAIIQIRHRRRHIPKYGSGSARLARAGRVVLTIRPTRAAAAALALGRRVSVTITITFTPAQGKTWTLRTVVLVPPSRGGRR